MKKSSTWDNAVQEAQELQGKLKTLEEIIASMRQVVVAYSGGVDSTLVLSLAESILGQNTLAVTASSEIIPQKEIAEAKRFAQELGVTHKIIYPAPLKNRDFTANSPERCYYCKYNLCSLLEEIKEDEGAGFMLDGTNLDDTRDYRPGKKAASEWGMRSPLLEASLTKEEIRLLSKARALPNWDRPSKACLASRIPYGQEITKDALRRIEQAEDIVSRFGPRQIRVRMHDPNTARIEVEPDQIESLVEERARSLIVRELRELGFMYIAIDLRGYQAGSINEPIWKTQK